MTVDSTIRYNSRCDGDSSTNRIEYSLEWSVFNTEMIYKNDTLVVDYDLLRDLDDYLKDEYADKTMIEIFVTDYMQAGLLYEFELTLKWNCDGAGQCQEVSAVHDLMYDYAYLKCTITGSDLNLVNVDPQLDNVEDVSFTLNGYSVTWYVP